jgi:lysophospholipase L1-like esterase
MGPPGSTLDASAADGSDGSDTSTADAEPDAVAGLPIVVVLGSSTAAGRGASTPEKSWVGLFRASVESEFPGYAVENRAAGGSTTYEVQADDFVPPPDRPPPLPGRNITTALALLPRAIVLNFPSNDQASHYTPEEQMANYERVATLAANAGVGLWVSTTQPRSFRDDARRTGLMVVRDAVQTRFGRRALDFWTGLAEPDGSLKAAFDYGDGIHVNEAGHALLATRAVAARIPANP